MLGILVMTWTQGSGHEMWFLSDSHAEHLSSLPSPEIFNTFTVTNITIFTVAVFIILLFILLDKTGARELFPLLQARLRANKSYATVIFRFLLALTLINAFFGFEGRVAVPEEMNQMFIAPDLQMLYVASYWQWLSWSELVIAIMLIAGIYVRFAAGAFIALLLLAAAIFGYDVFDYAILALFAGIYLSIVGPEKFYLPLPTIWGLGKLRNVLENFSDDKAAFLLRILTGLNLVYIGIHYKFLQPNLAYEIIEKYQVPTFGFEIATFVFIMGTVEVASGVLLLLGRLVRCVALVILGALLFFSIILNEGFAHLMIYGVMIVLFFTSGGSWSRKKPNDKPANIVIVGGDFSAVHAAIKIEKLMGEQSNIHLTFIHHDTNFIFRPLISEVGGSTIGPSSIANPLRCIFKNTRCIQGYLTHVDGDAKEIHIKRINDSIQKISYDELMIVGSNQVNFQSIPGLAINTMPFSLLADAFDIKREVIESFEMFPLIEDEEQRKSCLTYVVIGKNQSSLALACEIKILLNVLCFHYKEVNSNNICVKLILQPDDGNNNISDRLIDLMLKKLDKQGIEVIRDDFVTEVSSSHVFLESGKIIRANMIVNTMQRNSYLLEVINQHMDIAMDQHNRLVQYNNIFLVESGLHDFLQEYSVLRLDKFGRHVGYNIWAQSQGYPLKPWRNFKNNHQCINLGRYASVMKLYDSVYCTGYIPWVFSRFICLLSLPGLERNCRMLVDLCLDGIFLNSIGIVLNKRQVTFQTLYYRQGEKLAHTEDFSTSILIIKEGRVEAVTAQGNKQLLQPGQMIGDAQSHFNAPTQMVYYCRSDVLILVIPKTYAKFFIEGRDPTY